MSLMQFKETSKTRMTQEARSRDRTTTEFKGQMRDFGVESSSWRTFLQHHTADLHMCVLIMAAVQTCSLSACLLSSSLRSCSISSQRLLCSLSCCFLSSRSRCCCCQEKRSTRRFRIAALHTLDCLFQHKSRNEVKSSLSRFSYKC